MNENTKEWILGLRDERELCGGNICVDCALCQECGRTVGEPHINNCACPEGAKHWHCAACMAKSIAKRLAPYESYRACPDCGDAGGIGEPCDVCGRTGVAS